jgi:acyl-[acyl-carrier-protein]-phospholipid O-acyltransferase/long-chain-fatty-acid--[acyl-carrier-protein] ligase
MTAESRHPLRGLLIAQFCGAFNDNAWKLMVALLAIRQATAHLAPGPELETVAQTQTAITFVIFTLPLVLLSLVGGTLADRVSKRTVIIAIKVVELLMSAGTVALWMNPAGGILPLIVLCGMGVHSALFSPSKYGILPELIPHERLAAQASVKRIWPISPACSKPTRTYEAVCLPKFLPAWYKSAVKVARHEGASHLKWNAMPPMNMVV